MGIAQEKGMPVNFHIVSGDIDVFHIGNEQNGVHANTRRWASRSS